jgi:hypothetical protein
MILSCCFNIHDIKFKLGKTGVIVYIDNNTYKISSLTIVLDEKLKPSFFEYPTFFASHRIILFEHNKDLRQLLKMHREIKDRIDEFLSLAYRLKYLTGDSSVSYNAEKTAEQIKKHLEELGLPDGVFETRLPFARRILHDLLDMLDEEIEKLRRQIVEATLFSQ